MEKTILWRYKKLIPNNKENFAKACISTISTMCYVQIIKVQELKPYDLLKVESYIKPFKPSLRSTSH